MAFKALAIPQTEGPRVLLGVDGASAVLVLLGGTCPGTGGLKVHL